MTKNEMDLINLIRNHKHPEQALTTALEITLNYLMQPQSFATPLVADSLEHA